MPSYDPGDGHLLHYDDVGAGRPVVLLHGWACHAGYFTPQIDGLADRFRIVAPDLRGHRRSHRPGDAPDLAMLAEDLHGLLVLLGPPAAVLVGWSMGALVAFEYIRRFGAGGIAGLVVVDMTPRVVNDAGWDLGLIGGYGAAQAERAPVLMRQDWARWVEAFLPAVLADGRDPDPALLGWIAGAMRGCDPEAMATLWRAIATADYRADVGSITVPTLILRGARSRLYGPRTAAWLADAIPGAALATVPEAGHAPHLEQPDDFNRLLAAFGDSVPFSPRIPVGLTALFQ